MWHVCLRFDSPERGMWPERTLLMPWAGRPSVLLHTSHPTSLVAYRSAFGSRSRWLAVRLPIVRACVRAERTNRSNNTNPTPFACDLWWCAVSSAVPSEREGELNWVGTHLLRLQKDRTPSRSRTRFIP